MFSKVLCTSAVFTNIRAGDVYRDHPQDREESRSVFSLQTARTTSTTCTEAGRGEQADGGGAEIHEV